MPMLAERFGNPGYSRATWLITRGMALVYLIAFVSLAVQVEGLYGSNGILPVSSYLELLRARAGENAWHSFPSLLWLRHDDAALVGLCWAGAGASVALLLGILPLLSAFACWALYLSLFVVGRVFLSFQWDLLLLEAGFLAIFAQPVRLRADSRRDGEPSFLVVLLFRWLLLRLMFASGMVKLLSDDPVWWNLSALEYHYWTQPLPTWTAWHVHQLPTWVHRLSTAAMFFIELVVPFFVFGPRRARIATFLPLVLLQLAIMATGNYTYFNLLTIVLCLSVLDDEALPNWLRPTRGSNGVVRGVWPVPESERWWHDPKAALRMVRGGVALVAALGLAAAGGAQMASRLGVGAYVPWPVVRLTQAIEPLRLTSSYGLFSVMTRMRPEVVLEGSRDGVQWLEYEFRWKPGDVGRPPGFVQPHQPRLDWQMWFAALGDPRRNAWVTDLQRRLLQGSPPVLALLERNPFGDEPPRHVRAMLYDYQFTDLQTRATTGAWWTRRLVRPYSPTVSR